MFKLSPAFIRLLVIVAVLGGIAYYATLPSPTPATTGHSKYNHFETTATATTSDGSGIIAADYTAHFPPYKGGGRNPFIPLVSMGSALTASGGSGSTSSWSLTGINTIDGVRSALVENGATGDSAFLHSGDQWNGLRVETIGDDSVTFVDSSGNVTELSFPLNMPDAGTNPAGGAPNSPGGGGAGLGLPPAPVTVPNNAAPGPIPAYTPSG